MWRSIAAFVGRLFLFSEFSGDCPPTINRHWILHGKAAPNWKKVDALKLFQAIHTVSCVFDIPRRNS